MEHAHILLLMESILMTSEVLESNLFWFAELVAYTSVMHSSESMKV